MRYTIVVNPRFENAEKTSIICSVQFDHIDGLVEFAAQPDDVEAHGREIFQRCINGDFGPVVEYVPPTPSIDEQIESLKVYTQYMLDAEARKLGFDSMSDAITYVDEPAVPLYQEQAKALRAWRSIVWSEFDAYKQLMLEEQDVEIAYTQFGM